jgi:hypothetical protein
MGDCHQNYGNEKESIILDYYCYFSYDRNSAVSYGLDDRVSIPGRDVLLPSPQRVNQL